MKRGRELLLPNLLKRTSISILQQSLLMVVQVATTIMLARLFSPSEFGVYVFAIAVMGILSVLAQSGLPTLVLRETVQNLASGSVNFAAGVLRRARLALLISSVVIIAVAAPIILIKVPAGPEKMVLLISLILVPTIGFVRITGAALRGAGRDALGQFVQLNLRPTAFLVGLLLILALIGRAQLAALNVMAVHVTMASLAALVAFALHKRAVEPQLQGVTPAYKDRIWLGSLWKLSLIAGMQVIIAQSDIVMLRAFRTSEEVGFYRIAIQGATTLFFFKVAVTQAVAPMLAKSLKTGDTKNVQRIVAWMNIVRFLGALVPGLIAIIFAAPIITLLFGAEYLPAIAPLILLSVGKIAEAIAGPGEILLKMSRNEGNAALLSATATLLNIGLNFVLIPRFGMSGAAIASAIALVFWAGMMSIQAQRRLGIRVFLHLPRPRKFSTRKFSKGREQ